MSWKALEPMAAARLWPARCQLHWALQPLASLGKLLVPAQPDASEQSFTWLPDASVLAQDAVGESVRVRAALRLSPPTLLLLTDSGATHALVLSGRTLDQAEGWVDRKASELLARPLPGPLERPAGLPSSPFAEGAAFDAADEAAFAALERLYADAHFVLSRWAAARPHASEVRCWPHHLDIATLLTLERKANGEVCRSVGLGMVPGDEQRKEPYFYVTPSPSPDPPPDHALPCGSFWHREGWFGAVLPVAHLAALSAVDQERELTAFLEAAAATGEEIARQGKIC
jgi:hypothetical protein